MPNHALIMQTLKNSQLMEELREHEIEEFAKLVVIHHFQPGETILKPGAEALRDSLLILASGEAELQGSQNSDVVLHTANCGDIVGVIGFVGGNAFQISATLVAKTEVRILEISRASFEALLSSQLALAAYYVLRGIVRSMHSIVRQMQRRVQNMNDYCHSTGRHT